MDIKLTNDEKQLIANSLEDCILHSIKCIKLYTEENSESELNSAKYELERFSLAKSKFLENDFYDTRTIEILLESISNRIDDLKALLFQLEKNHNYQKVIENCKYIEDCFQLCDNFLSQIEDSECKIRLQEICESAATW